MNSQYAKGEVVEYIEFQEFIKRHQMTKKIVLVPNNITAIHSIRKCNEEGIVCVNLEYRTIKELAYELCKEDYALKNLEFKAIDQEVSVNIMIDILKRKKNELLYFNREEWIDLSTASEIITQLNDIRLTGAEEKLHSQAKAKASRKLEDLTNLLQEYVSFLEKESLLDYIEVLKKATSIVKQRKQETGKADNNVLYAVLANVQAIGLEKELITEYTKGSYCVIKAPYLQDLSVPTAYFAKQKEAFTEFNDFYALYSPIKKKIERPQIDFFRSYGMINEVKYVMQDILQKGYCFGETQVIYANDAYALLFYNYAKEHQIALSLTDGIPGYHSNSYAFIRDLFQFVKNGYFLGDLKPVLYNSILKMDNGSNRQAYKLLCGDKQLNEEELFSGEELLLGRESWFRWIDKHKNLNNTQSLRDVDIAEDDTDQKFAEYNTEHNLAEYDTEQNLAGYDSEQILAGYDSDQEAAKNTEVEAQLSVEEAVNFAYNKEGHLAEIRDFIADILKLFPENLSLQTSFDAFIAKLEQLLRTHCIRKKRIWNKEIHQYIDAMKSLALYNNCSSSYFELMEQILVLLSKQRINTDEEAEDAILVTSCDASGLVIRPYVYVIGLDADSFPKRGNESPVLLDEERIAVEMDFHLASMTEKNSIYSLLEQLSGCNGRVVFGYNYFDTVAIREKNPSSFYQLLTDKQELLKGSIHMSGFVSHQNIILDEKELYLRMEKASGEDKSYLYREKYIEKAADKSVEKEADEVGQKTYSASSLDVFISCPKSFYFKYIAKLAIVEDNKLEPTVWLDPAQAGTFIHKLLQDYVQQVIIDEQMMDFQKGSFDRIYDDLCELVVKLIPYKSRNTYMMKRQEYKTQAEAYLEKLCKDMKAEGFKPIAVEWIFGKKDKLEVELPLNEKASMKFSGSIDRIDLLADGSYRIVDYKTGKADKKKRLRTSDRDDLIQDYIYTMVYEHINKNEVSISETRYEFPCDRNDFIKTIIKPEIIETAKSRLIKILEAIKNNRYERCAENSDIYPDHEMTCKYCDFLLLCTAQRNAWEEGENN